MKTKLFIFLMLTWGTFNCKAQTDDYSTYLDKARENIEAGDCEGAQKFYNVYKELSGQTSSLLEKSISDCNRWKNSKKTYSIGDDAKDFIGEEGYKIAYLDASEKHGFAIKRWDGEYEYCWFSNSEGPSITELQLIYGNRYILNLKGEYWSSTVVEGTGSAFTMPKYYTFNFSTGEKKKRREPLMSEKKNCFQNLSIFRF